jgi:hypothetical protein
MSPKIILLTLQLITFYISTVSRLRLNPLQVIQFSSLLRWYKKTVVPNSILICANVCWLGSILKQTENQKKHFSKISLRVNTFSVSVHR